MPLIPRRLPFRGPAALMSAASRHLPFRFPGPIAPCPRPFPRFLASIPRKSPPGPALFALRPSGFRPPRQPTLPTAREFHDVPQESEIEIGKRLGVLRRRLEEFGFDPADCVPGEHSNLLCPMCQGGKSMERSLSLNISEDGKSAMWNCHRGKCGWASRIQSTQNKNGPQRKTSERKTLRGPFSEEELHLEPLSEVILDFLWARRISAETLRRNGVMELRCSDGPAIAFPYRRNGTIVSCKYRTVYKKFWLESDTEKIFYGLDDVKDASDVIIVEGEMDKLAMEEAGYTNCVSVPDGAPAKVSKDLPKEDKDIKFQYLSNCKEYLDRASRIILATDADGPGQALAEELARRIGKERCWRVEWPVYKGNVLKDANEVLMFIGPGGLRELIENAELYPIRGLFKFSSFFQEIDDYYYCKNGYDRGISTGWRALNDLYNVVPGELTVVTGVPNSGKSEWIDALLCNINKSHGWSFVLCSMENKVREHARKLLEKHIGKPFFNANYGGSVERMNEEEYREGKKWVDETFHLIRCEDDSLPSVSWVLDLAKAAVLRHGVRGLVIDPYNELDHQRPSNQTETEYVSQMLTKIKRFAQHHSCHVWFVAHPRQLQQWVGRPPSLYDISGSAHFINKCDNGIVIHRNRDEKSGPLDRVEVYVRKVRNKVIGNIGTAFLKYDRVNGRFLDLDDSDKQEK